MAYKLYKGTFDTEYAGALAREQGNRDNLDKSLAALRGTDEQGLAQSKSYSTSQLAKSLGNAQKSTYGQFRQAQKNMPIAQQMQGITGGGVAYQNAMLGQNYLNTRSAAQSEHDKALSDVNQQWLQGMNDIASRYGEMGYQNMQNMYNNANANAWNAYNNALNLDQNMWTRGNTTAAQNQAQVNADLEYKRALAQWKQQKKLQEEAVQIQNQLAQAQLAASQKG